METFLRTWRQDAMNKHQYESAIFMGDKLLALTGDDQDAFFLAQVHFSTGNFTRAQGFLERHDLINRTASCRYLASLCLIKQGKYEEAVQTLGERNPIHLVHRPSNSRRKLQHADGDVRNGTSRPGKSSHRVDRSESSDVREKNELDNIKFEAAMCFLRGLCFAKQNAFDRAKDCYKISVQIDVQNFEAFDQLMKNSLMSPDEEWEFIESLDFDSIRIQGSTSASQEAAAFTKNLYITRLSKYKNTEALTAATEDLSTHYNLSQNPDILLSRAELLFTQCRFRQTLSITTSILEADKHNFAIYPLHLACLHELNQKSALFLIAHELTNSHPEEPCAWLAVGTYYLTTNRIAEARRYFSKASMMDPHFGPAWIGFAHTFAAEGEHDQAISAYSTAARLFQGTHLPQLYLGMQNLQLNQMTLADEYFTAAYGLCNTDPLLLNERGVVAFHQDHLHDAILDFSQALTLATAVDAEPAAFISTRANLAHAYRRTGAFNEALREFEDVLRIGGKNAGVFTAKGLVLLELGRTYEAIVAFHEALAVSPQDPIATDLLGKALEENAELGAVFGEMGDDDEVEFEHLFQGARELAAEKARSAAAARGGSGTGRRRRADESEMRGRRGSGYGLGFGLGSGSGSESGNGNGRSLITASGPVPPSSSFFSTATTAAPGGDGSSMMAVSEDEED